MRYLAQLISLMLVFSLTVSFAEFNGDTHSLTVVVKNLKNSKGVVQFCLYNRDGSIPDEKFKNYYKKSIGKIESGESSVVFSNLPSGKYAVNILHDENEDGIIQKGWVLPVEGIGFSNLQSIGISNRPSFKSTSFDLKMDRKIEVKVIYM